ncbi:MAG: 5'-nucleotidase [bacterium]|nr:5'-nucleotidase [bacterium]
MRSKISLCWAILIALMLRAFSICYALGNENPPMYLLKLSSIGFPTAEKQKDAWKINVLRLFNGRLYLGHGDATVNTGPTDVIYYDLQEKKFVTEFTVDEEGIYTYKIVDENLIIPGIDATESWELGNIYVLTDTGWVKHRTVTRGIHVFDVVSFDRKWYVATGSNFEFGNVSPAFGTIQCSEDSGKSWKFAYATPCDDATVFRIVRLLPYKGNLYAFPYAYGGMAKKEIPKEYRAYLGEPYTQDEYGEYYALFVDDPLGAEDVIIYDGKQWKTVDLVQQHSVCTISPFVFKDKLIMSVLHGKYINPFIDFVLKGGELPKDAKTALYAFDGKHTKLVPFEYDFLRDAIVQDDKLFVLIVKDKQYFIAETSDLKRWKYYTLPPSLKKPKTIEYDGESFYIGMEDGNIFKSTGLRQLTDLSQIKAHEPIKFFGAAELPRDGKWYWAAITGWVNWGRLAKFSCEVKPGNIIDIATDNISAISIFVPLMEIDETKPVILDIDGQEVFRDEINGKTELICKYLEGGKCKIEKGRETAETFKYSRKIIGKSEIELTRTGDDPPIGVWKAEVFRWVAKTDVAIISRSGIRKDLKKGDIALEDIFDMNYRNSICTFSVKGKTLREMVEFNIKLPKTERCQISGFKLTYKAYKDSEKNTVVDCSLDPEKEYLVATSDYLAKRTKKFLGQEVDYEDIGLQVTEAMIQWFEQYEKIGKIHPRIKVIKAK